SSAEHATTYDHLLERLDDPMKRALDRVPEIYRAPFIMAILEGLTCAEIATRLGVPEGTVLSRIHRARARIKRDLRYVPESKPSVPVLLSKRPRAAMRKRPAA